MNVSAKQNVYPNIYRIYFFANCFFSIITFFVSFIVDKGIGYELMPIIPLVYFVCFALGKDIHYYSVRYPGVLILNVLMFLKYVVTIFFTSINHNYELARYYQINVIETSYRMATIIILIELCSVFATISFAAHRIYEKSDQNKSNIIIRYQKINFGPILLLALGCGGLTIIHNRKEYIARSMIIFSDNTALSEKIEINNSLSLIFHTLNIVIIGLLINYFIVMYDKSRQKKYIIWSYIAITALVFLSISTSRMNIVIPFVLFILITSKRFGKTGTVLNAVAFVGLLIVFAIVSMYKNPWRYVEGSTISGILLEFARGMQEYTSGILPTAVGLQAISSYGNSITIFTFFNDFLGAVPGIAGFINQEDRLNYYYNLYALGGSSTSQIIPMSISSCAYFSWIFSFILVDICIILLFWVESRTYNKEDRYSNFIHEYQSLYLCFILASSINSNLQIVSGRFFVNYLPPMLILYFNGLITIKNNKKAS